MTLDQIIIAAHAELQRAKEIHPERDEMDIVHRVAIVGEESGEALQAANDVRWLDGNIQDVEDELIQTIATAMRVLEWID